MTGQTNHCRVDQRRVDQALKGLLNEVAMTPHPMADLVIRRLWDEVQGYRNTRAQASAPVVSSQRETNSVASTISPNVGCNEPDGDAVAYCDPSDPINSTAFAWPGTDRQSCHTEPLYTRSNAKAGEVEAVEVASKAYAALLSITSSIWRLRNMETYCSLRDFIADKTGRTPQEVQEHFEGMHSIFTQRGDASE